MNHLDGGRFLRDEYSLQQEPAIIHQLYRGVTENLVAVRLDRQGELSLVERVRHATDPGLIPGGYTHHVIDAGFHLDIYHLPARFNGVSRLLHGYFTLQECYRFHQRVTPVLVRHEHENLAIRHERGRRHHDFTAPVVRPLDNGFPVIRGDNFHARTLAFIPRYGVIHLVRGRGKHVRETCFIQRDREHLPFRQFYHRPVLQF